MDKRVKYRYKKEIKVMTKKHIQSPEERIRQLRHEIMGHSILYYRLDISLVDDYKFDAWCRELKVLQDAYPQISKEVVLHDIFQDWNGKTSQCHTLPYEEFRFPTSWIRNYIMKNDIPATGLESYL